MPPSFMGWFGAVLDSDLWFRSRSQANDQILERQLPATLQPILALFDAQAANFRTAVCQRHRIGCVRAHGEISIAGTQFWLEARKKMIRSPIPVDQHFYARQGIQQGILGDNFDERMRAFRIANSLLGQQPVS